MNPGPGFPAPDVDSAGPSLEPGYSFTFLDHSIVPRGDAKAPPCPAVAPFVLRRLIGMGGQGEVWEAWQSSLEREVAVKIHRRGDVGAFLDEALLTGELDHPNIVPVLDLGSLAAPGSDSSTPVMAMKRIRGLRWDELITTERGDAPPSHEYWTRHLGILHSVCHAVAYAHSRGIVHLDLKPAQVIVGEFGEVYLMDWGIAARIDDRPGRGRHVSQIVGALGTPAYMAPEQACGDAQAIGVATDVYLLGALAYHIATGRGPHPGAMMDEIIDHARRNTLLPIGDNTPPPLAAIIARALSAAPAARYPTAESFRTAIDDFLGTASHQREAQEIAEACRNKTPTLDALGYDDLTALERQLDRAQTLAPNLAGIDGLRDDVLAAHMRRAVKTGDLELARLLADRIGQRERRDDALSSVDAALSARRAQDRQRILARRAAVAALVALVVVMLGASYSLLRYYRTAVVERERAEAALETSQYEVARSSLQAALAHLQRSRPLAARESLSHTPEALRGWEWGYLASAASPEVKLLSPREEIFDQVVLSRDESTLASRRDGDAALLLYDLQSDGAAPHADTTQSWTTIASTGARGFAVGSAKGHVGFFTGTRLERLVECGERPILFLAAVENGIVFAADDAHIVWRIDKAGAASECWRAPVRITALAAQGDGFAAGSMDGSVWHTADYRRPPVMTETLHEATVRGVAWQPGGTLLASWAVAPSAQQPTSDPRLILHQVGDPVAAFVGKGDGFAVTAVGWAPDGETVYVGTASIELYAMSPQGEVRYSRNLNIGVMNGVQVSDNGAFLTTITRQRIEVYALRTGTLRRSMPVDSRRVTGWAIGSDHLFVCGLDGGLGQWRWDRIENQRSLGLYPDRVLSMDLASEAPRMMTAHQRGFVGVWHTDGDRYEMVAEIWMEGPVVQVCAAPDGRSLLALVANTEVRFVRTEEAGQSLQRRWPMDERLSAIALSPRGSEFVAAREAGGLLAGSGDSDAAPLPRGDATIRYTAMAYSPDGAWLLAGREDGLIDVLDAESLMPLRMMRGHSGTIRSLTFGGENLVVSASDDETARLWDLATGKLEGTYRGTHAGPVRSALLTHDGQRVVTGCADAAVRVFDRDNALELVALEEHFYGVLDMAFSPRSDCLLSAGQDGRLRWWVPQAWTAGDVVLANPMPRDVDIVPLPAP